MRDQTVPHIWVSLGSGKKFRHLDNTEEMTMKNVREISLTLFVVNVKTCIFLQ